MSQSPIVPPVIVPSPLNRRLAADSALIGIALIWGATFFMVKDATHDFPVLAFLTLRFTLAGLVLLPLALRLRRWPRRAELRWGIAAGVILCVSYIAQTFALRLISSGRTGFLTGLYVVMVPFLGLMILRQRVTVRVLIGTACAMIGLTLLSYAPGGNLLGDLLAALAALMYALQILVIEKFPRGLDWRMTTLIQIACVVIFCGVLLPILAALHDCAEPLCVALHPVADPLPSGLPLPVLTTALFTGVFASGLALSVQTWAQRILPPSDTALIFALELPSSAVFGALFRGETFTPLALIGSGLMLIGMLITALAKSKPPDVASEVSSAHPSLSGEG